MDNIVYEYFYDIGYSLYQAKFLTDTNDRISKYEETCHELSKEELKILYRSTY